MAEPTTELDNAFELLDAIEDYVARAVAPLAKRIVDLEHQISASGATPAGEKLEEHERK